MDPEKQSFLPQHTTSPPDRISSPDLKALGAASEKAERAAKAARNAYETAWLRSPRGWWVRRIAYPILYLCAIAMLINVLFLSFCTGRALYSGDWSDFNPPLPGAHNDSVRVADGTVELFSQYEEVVLMSGPGVPDTTSEKVHLEAHIMSKCPDARDCLRDLVLPAMQNISASVSFTLSYIGKTEGDEDVVCKHGPQECLGNMIELCAAQRYPDPKIYLGFTMCLSNSYDRIPKEDLVKSCALEYGMSFDEVNKCMSEDDGEQVIGLLRDSVEHSEEVGVKKSCTVRVEDKIWCVRDGGKWNDCPDGHEPKDLVQAIMKAKKRRQEESSSSELP